MTFLRGSAGVPDQRGDLRRQVSRCASWFFWIAVMTLVNSAMLHSGSDTTFMIGLTFSQVADAMSVGMGATAKTASLLFDAAGIGVFLLLGMKAQRGHRWAFVVGFILYGCDTLLSLLAPHVISLALHGWALFAMGLGVQRAGKLRAAEAEATLPPVLHPPGAETATTETALPPPLAKTAADLENLA